MPNMAAYYATIAQNYLQGKMPTAREQYKALSKRQKANFFVHLSEEWQSEPGDNMYQFFKEML